MSEFELLDTLILGDGRRIESGKRGTDYEVTVTWPAGSTAHLVAPLEPGQACLVTAGAAVAADVGTAAFLQRVQREEAG